MNSFDMPSEYKRFPAAWKVLPFSDAIKDVTGGNPKVKSSDYLEQGPLAVVDQGQSNIAGYIENESLACKASLPTIVFGDHTKALKFIEQPFALGADGVKVLEPIDVLDKRFVYHYLNQLSLPDSAGYSRHFKFLKEKFIPLPPLPEQRRIAIILDKVDTIRRKRQQAIRLTEEFLRSVFLDMFGDPVMNPKGWAQKRLGSLCEVGSSKRVFVNELVETGVPFYRGTEIGQLGAGQTVEPSLFITKEHYEKLKAESGIPGRGDLLLPSICPDGRIYLVETDEPFYFKDGRVLWIKAGESHVNSVFLRFYLKQLFFATYSKIASGTTFAELKIFVLKDLVINFPPPEQQKRFAAIAESIEKQKCRQSRHQIDLDTLFTAIQQCAFRGDL